jgi:hypothetical protein
MGLLDGTTQSAYYQGGEKGGYQFTSLEDIINQFLVAYVGEEKVISKVSRTDVAFHAQRAMQELSFDTFKSIKSQEIVLPPSNTMMLPHDYVNYTRVMWSDGAGIKHPLYPTRDTQNPFKILQATDGSYEFSSVLGALIINSDFSSSALPIIGDYSEQWIASTVPNNPTIEDISITSGKLTFTHGSREQNFQYTPAPASQPISGSGTVESRAYAVVQKIDVTGMNKFDLTATGLSAAADGTNKDAGILRVGLTTRDPNGGVTAPSSEEWNKDITVQTINSGPGGGWGASTGHNPLSRNHTVELFDVFTTDGTTRAYMEWNGETTELTSTLLDVDVEGLTEVYLVVTSHVPNYTQLWTSANSNQSVNTVDDISIVYAGQLPNLQSGGDSTTWTNYKSGTPSENQNSYDDGTYDLIIGERYGLDPQHAQVNGSYYIDNLRGLINFSSNVSGKTVILDYISDSLGTDGEMQVHKFAEEAMYKWIMYAILSTRANTPEYIVKRYQKEKFAATRTAKLRLSNIKLEELTQILRGKSKWIKH